MRFGRWTIGLAALLIAGLALYVLTSQDAGRGSGTKARDAGSNASTPGRPVSDPGDAPALDEIDAASREAMRDLLREEGEEDEEGDLW